MSVLGNKVAAPEGYSPEVLDRIDRTLGRSSIERPSRFVSQGHDIWHCYELSWRLADGTIRYTTGALIIPASSAFTVESKSLKLYLNSLNAHVFEDDASAVQCIESDVSLVTQSDVTLRVMDFDVLRDASRLLGSVQVSGQQRCGVQTQQLSFSGLRTLCPVTSQPDWASLVVEVSAVDFDAREIESAVESLRNHQGFHEQCIEDLYSRLETSLKPEQLTVVGFFQRRGGIDITPWRSSLELPPSVIRLVEQ